MYTRSVINFMSNMSYSDQQRATYLELASEVGITRAIRQLGFPSTWATGKRWCDAAGIEVPIDEIKAQAAAHHDWYKTEDMLIVAQAGIERVYLALQREELSPDEHKKMSEAFQKYSNTWLLLQGKANSINENRKTDSLDIGLMELMKNEERRNETIEKGVESA